MLSRGGGAVAFQKVVSRVADLPSPLDAEQGQRIIVRETEEVYGLNSTTRMWEVIGTLKKVGGKRPEELASHVDSDGNPHKISLQDVLAAGSKAGVTEEIVISGKNVEHQLRLLSDKAALRYGLAAGSPDGILWLNTGVAPKTILRAVDSKGVDQIVVSGNGSITSAGAASFAGGFKGPAKFEDEITASEGVRGAKGFDLVLDGDNGIALNVGSEIKAYLGPDKLSVHGGLGLKGDLRIGGTVRSSLNPAPALEGLTLGVSQARWASAALGDLDVAGQVLVRIPDNSQKAPFQVSGSAPAHGAILTALGKLGLGTDAPEARLDVRGEVLVGSEDSRLKLSGTGLSHADWGLSFAGGISVTGEGKQLLRLTAAGVELTGPTKVEGSLKVTGELMLGAVQGLYKQALTFKGDGSTLYSAKTHQFDGALTIDVAKGADLLTLKSDGATLVRVASDGTLLGGELGRADDAWGDAHFAGSVNVGETTYEQGKISHSGEFSISTNTLVAGPELRLIGKEPRISVLNGLKIESSGASALLKPGEALSFSKPTKVNGVSELTAGSVATKSLDVSGNASFCGGSAVLSKEGLRLGGGLNIGGLAFKKVQERVTLKGKSTRTGFELPAGVRVEAVLVKLATAVTGARFIQVGDLADADRFASATTNLSAGTLIRGLAHWDRGRVVQKKAGPIVVSSDLPASGDVIVTVHYVDPAAL